MSTVEEEAMMGKRLKDELISRGNLLASASTSSPSRIKKQKQPPMSPTRPLGKYVERAKKSLGRTKAKRAAKAEEAPPKHSKKREAIVNRASPPKKGKRYEVWQQMYDSSPEDIKPYLAQYRKDGYFVFRDVFSREFIAMLLHGQNADAEPAIHQHRLSRAAHIARERWAGALNVIEHNRREGGGICALRGKGRYDLPLPRLLEARLHNELESKGVMRIIKAICPKARVTTTNVMLSEPGSERQPIHTDSVWDGCARKDPLPHYLTVLIPLTVQDHETGGTRVWPGSHNDSDMDIKSDSGYLDMIVPRLNMGDALIFDGLLSHCGMENTAKERDRLNEKLDEAVFDRAIGSNKRMHTFFPSYQW